MNAVKKYLFWACVPVGLVIAVVAGMMAIGSTKTELEELKKKFDSQKSSMSQLRGAAATHPNQGTIKAVNEMRQCPVCAEGGDCSMEGGVAVEAKCLFRDVYAAWETMERAQRDQNRWRGLAAVATQEIESNFFLDDLSSTTLDSYLGFAPRAIDGLQENSRESQEERGLLEYPNDIRRVDDRRQMGGQWVTIGQTVLTTSGKRGGTGFGGGGAQPSAALTGRTQPGDQYRGKVVWNSPSLDFTMKNWTRRPQPFEVWLTQEDLWVYQALLWVIAKSNEGVTENGVPATVASTGAAGNSTGGASGANARALDLSHSVVKEIIDLSIGTVAAQELQNQSIRRINRASSGAEGGAGASSFGSAGGAGAGSSGGGTFGSVKGPGGTTLTPEAAKSAALEGRYVDADGAPLSAPDLTKQYRRMPIYLNLRVDQRFISDVLVHCANCPMPIDVLWVTVNPANTQSFDFASASSSTSGAPMGFSGAGGARRPGAGGAAARSTTGGGGVRGGASSTGSINYGTDEVIVEIYGCINIFAPPDTSKIGGGQ